MRRRLLLFFVVAELTLAGCALYHWGGGLTRVLGQNLSLKFYNGVLHMYAPSLIYAGSGELSGICLDVTASFSPVLAANEEQLQVRENEEELVSQENLAAEENERAQQILAENEQARTEVTEATQADETGTAGGTESETETEAETESESETETESADGTADDEKKATVNRKKLEDFDYLLRTFYQVDNTTTIGSDQLNVEALLEPDMSIDTDTDGPQILIYHTHSQECYADSEPGDAATSVVGVGDYLTELLEAEGFQVLHHTGVYDANDRDHAYSNAAPAIEQLLEDNPTIQVVIDLHRDGVSDDTRLVTEIDGKKMAKIMFFNGLSRTTAAGDIAYLKNPYIAENLAFSFQMQLAAAEYYPDLTRRIYLKGYRFNMHLCPKSLLVEVGAQTNTFEEAKNAMEPLAKLLKKVL